MIDPNEREFTWNFIDLAHKLPLKAHKTEWLHYLENKQEIC